MTLNNKNLKQTVDLAAKPMKVYKALLSSKEHSAFTGSVAKVSDKLGGKTSAYEGWIEAENLQLAPGKKIVQAWREADWPEGHFSRAIFDFKGFKGGCRLTFTQEGVPAGKFHAIKEGWAEHYWDKMKVYFAAKAGA